MIDTEHWALSAEHSKNISKISGEIKKAWKSSKVNKCNQQQRHPKTIAKINGEMKTSEETMIKKPLRCSPKKSRSFSSLGFNICISWNIRSFLRVGFFNFWALKVAHFWDSIIIFYGISVFWRVKKFKSFGLENAGFHFRKCKISFNRRVRKVHLSRNKRNFFQDQFF